LLAQAAETLAEQTTKQINKLQIKKAVVVLDNRPCGELKRNKTQQPYP
jgi:hypothetical protein